MTLKEHVRLRHIMADYIVVPAHEPPILGEEPLRFPDEAAALRFLGGLLIDGDGRQQLGHLYYELDIGGSLGVGTEEITRAIAAQLVGGQIRVTPAHSPRSVSASAPVERAASGAAPQPNVLGMSLEHVDRIRDFCRRKGFYLIVRAGNADSLAYHGKAGFISKPKEVKAFKTAKSGPAKGLVALDLGKSEVRPEGPKPRELPEADWRRVVDAWSKWKAEAGKGRSLAFQDFFFNARPGGWDEKRWGQWQHEWENWMELKADEWSFDRDGVLRDKQGRAVHGDYDVQGCYKERYDGFFDSLLRRHGTFEQVFVGDLVDELNKAVSPDHPMFRHGANDEGGTSEDDYGNFLDEEQVGNEIRAIMKRETVDPKEQFLVFHPTRELTALIGPAQLKAFYAGMVGVRWLYPDPKK